MLFNIESFDTKMYFHLRTNVLNSRAMYLNIFSVYVHYLTLKLKERKVCRKRQNCVYFN